MRRVRKLNYGESTLVHILIILICCGALVSYHYIDDTPDPHVSEVIGALIEEEIEHLFDDEGGDE